VTYCELVDAFILENHKEIGSKFAKADFREWLHGMGLYDIDAGTALQSHRKSPGQRKFTTKRIGMGPSSRYEVVGTKAGLRPKAAEEMHRQNGQEAVDRWFNEYVYRMYPLALRQRKARQAMRRAKAEFRLVAEVLHARMREIEDDKIGDDDE
jgi:hypothetical protein